jgi:type III pantothenate kinase
VRIAHENRADWAGRIADAWKQIERKENAAVAGASVNPGIEAEIEKVVREVSGREVDWVGKQIDLPIEVLTEKPAETGVDRIVNMAAAFEQMGKACVVVDAGTAITINVCDDKGSFLGGAIAPGARTMLKSLHEHTAKLPEIELAMPKHPIGKNTREAILLGVFHGIRGMVKELVENYAMELGFWPDIIATGGDAVKLFEGWELVHAIAPDLTLYGIALAYTNHHIKHES